ncbi:MAG: hypothetical protein WAM65_04545, partial [Candidatus Korobacteraceae bacterium]
RFRPEGHVFSGALVGTTQEAAEKVEKQIPRRPKGLLVMTKIKGAYRHDPRSCPDTRPSITDFFSGQ